MKLLSILTIITLSLNCFAQESVYLEKDKPAPYTGYLLSEQKVKDLRNDSLDADMYRRIVPLKDKQIELLTDQNTKLATTLVSTSSLTTWEKIGYFAAGIIVTALAVKGAHEIYK